ncbi:hydroxyisourate hydrolase [Kribbella sp. CA-293567]|uniref:hydroxyisourate hydrolase n=1 Tax=Kribbella sp. CA-293567 TaxID=3002436 RepID=UPI0022DE0FF5|nr:hydroxyisourate hydrolase [Kribbella sp. CA-293567]WBQ07964.1 hydroxyisourate hydrolase [Kribbella sp. CA-293567]
MSSLSTHVLDTALGKPAAGLQVTLTHLSPPDPTSLSSEIGSGTTDIDGRITEFTDADLAPGTYQLKFATAAYAQATNQETFFPEVTVTFTISAERHYHVPLLLSPFAFSTYRGS